MWLQFGDPGFVLPRQHGLLFRKVVVFLSDMVGWEAREDTDWKTDVVVFDQLTQGHKQVILYEVARATLDASSKPVQVHASLMGALAVVYQTIWQMIEAEIQTDNSCQSRIELRPFWRDKAGPK